MPATSHRNRRAFTLVELLTVIAIIAVLAAILLPVFSIAREQARQATTMGNMHDVYEAVRLYHEDEGTYPPALFGYAEIKIFLSSGGSGSSSCTTPPAGMPQDEPAFEEELSKPDNHDPSKGTCFERVPMGQATEYFQPTGIGAYLYPNKLKEMNAFLCPDNPSTDQKQGSIAYWPLTLTNGQLVPVTWVQGNNNTNPPPACPTYSDIDLPPPRSSDDVNYPNRSYVQQAKTFYVMDSMDIGPMLDSNGNWIHDSNGNPLYEYHYALDWTHQLYNQKNGCDTTAQVPVYGLPSNPPVVLSNQLKYKNPSPETTVITWDTYHAAVAHSGNVIVLLLSGTARKMSVQQAVNELPLNYH
ncbi:MAG TPA: prepilin-type N-terminal cleavage/methylation domain-containing protein [Chthonomonas sp.]|uniref:type II secretion system protein n=1 Tax=Chthonomonas sp. TaxID=2282153 RepID=UPI002B4AECC2|nr:prepilin-type N-terminal cleavage/methylation domain-containing protein [Chthonomonas sp.]HLI49231.1 prepilin-type N-terminal cleavage/methylation domain-containing protein [Chthonomonas sp.]